MKGVPHVFEKLLGSTSDRNRAAILPSNPGFGYYIMGKWWKIGIFPQNNTVGTCMVYVHNLDVKNNCDWHINVQWPSISNKDVLLL